MRKKIPTKAADEVAFSVDLRCCLCEIVSGLPPRVRNGQIHHLDGDPANNSPTNLVWLCLDHHEEAGKVGYTSRRLSSTLIERYRDHLRDQVARQRTRSKASSNRTGAFTAALDASVVVEVCKVRSVYGVDWETAGAAIAAIPMPEAMGYEARRAILEYLDDFAMQTRMKMPQSVAAVLARVVNDILPSRQLLWSRPSRASRSDIHLMQLGLAIGTCMAYDGALKLRNLKITEFGAEILWRSLSYSVLCKHRDLRGQAMAAFDIALDGARRSGLPIASRLLEEAQAHGMAGGKRWPEYSEEVSVAL